MAITIPTNAARVVRGVGTVLFQRHRPTLLLHRIGKDREAVRDCFFRKPFLKMVVYVCRRGTGRGQYTTSCPCFFFGYETRWRFQGEISEDGIDIVIAKGKPDKKGCLCLLLAGLIFKVELIPNVLRYPLADVCYGYGDQRDNTVMKMFL